MSQPHEVVISESHPEHELIEQLRKLHFRLVLAKIIEKDTPLSDLACHTKAEYECIEKIRARQELDEFNSAVAAITKA